MNRHKKVRVTFVLPELIDRALEMHCAATGQKKSVVAARALEAVAKRYVEALEKEKAIKAES